MISTTAARTMIPSNKVESSAAWRRWSGSVIEGDGAMNQRQSRWRNVFPFLFLEGWFNEVESLIPMLPIKSIGRSSWGIVLLNALSKIDGIPLAACFAGRTFIP